MSLPAAKVDPPAAAVAKATPPPVGKAPAWLASPAILLLVVGLLLPLAMVFVDSFRMRGTYGGFAPVEDLASYVTSGDFLANYAQAIKPIYLKIFWRSTWIAVVTTVLCLAAAYPIAYWMAVKLDPKRRSLALLGVVVPFWTSFVVRTFAWVWILRTEGLANTLLMKLGITSEPLPLLYNEPAVLIGLVYGELPFMILPIYASLEKLDRTLLEAAADLGANAWDTFWKVTWPLTLPGVVAGTVLVFVPSVGQFLISDMLGGAKSMLVGNLIQNQFFGGKNAPFGFAVAFILTALVLGMLWLQPRLFKGSSSEDLL
ncbi:MAG: ABC transporter permease [Myxococcota bacterium]